MNEEDLKKIEKNLNIEDDKASVFTTDKLKQFNEIYGYEDGPAVAGDQ